MLIQEIPGIEDTSIMKNWKFVGIGNPIRNIITKDR